MIVILYKTGLSCLCCTQQELNHLLTRFVKWWLGSESVTAGTFYWNTEKKSDFIVESATSDKGQIAKFTNVQLSCIFVTDDTFKHLDLVKQGWNFDTMAAITTEMSVVTVTANYSDNTSIAYQESGRDENLAKIEILVQAVIFALAVVGNSLVLLVLICR